MPLKKFRQIHDVITDGGPFVGLLSAFIDQPHAAWLLVACDMPLLGRRLIEALVRRRNPRKFSTAFVKVGGGMIEPLCTIYEPRIFPILQKQFDQGQRSLLKILEEVVIKRVACSNPEALRSVNRLKDLNEIMSLKIKKDGFYEKIAPSA